ncbi:replication initiation factor domain-containing protein [Bacillus pumilus]|uniref:replication initiation factor domain-containing protein n=1 Tax=Bacillus pumilus TaxID=1408 RepID=UPI0038794417
MTGLVQPPLANRGVQMTRKEKETVENTVTSMVDYIRVSFKTHDVKYIIQNVLNLHEDFMKHKPTGFYGYVGTYEMDMIKVFYSKPDDERGVLIEMSGQGCRQFEAFLTCQKKTWFDFFRECKDKKGKFTRLDIAIDDKKTYFSIPALCERIRRQECITKFKSISYDGSTLLDGGKPYGMTLYMGSKKSDVYFCFYQKGFEQAQKYHIPYDDIDKKWNRYELRLKDDRAEKAIQELLKKEDLTYIAISVINYYVRFVDKDERNKRHWEPSKFWTQFIGDVGKLRLAVKAEKDTFEKSYVWLKNNCAPIMRVVLEMDKAKGTNYISDMLLNANLEKKHIDMLETFLAERQMG